MWDPLSFTAALFGAVRRPIRADLFGEPSRDFFLPWALRSLISYSPRPGGHSVGFDFSFFSSIGSSPIFYGVGKNQTRGLLHFFPNSLLIFLSPHRVLEIEADPDESSKSARWFQEKSLTSANYKGYHHPRCQVGPWHREERLNIELFNQQFPWTVNSREVQSREG